MRPRNGLVYSALGEAALALSVFAMSLRARRLVTGERS
jgi:hypothetical protein